MPWLSIQSKDSIWHWAEGVMEVADPIVSSSEVREPCAISYVYTHDPLCGSLCDMGRLPAHP